MWSFDLDAGNVGWRPGMGEDERRGNGHGGYRCGGQVSCLPLRTHVSPVPGRRFSWTRTNCYADGKMAKIHALFCGGQSTERVVLNGECERRLGRRESYAHFLCMRIADIEDHFAIVSLDPRSTRRPTCRSSPRCARRETKNRRARDRSRRVNAIAHAGSPTVTLMRRIRLSLEPCTRGARAMRKPECDE